MDGQAHGRREPTGVEGLREQHLKQDDTTCSIWERGAGERHAQELPGAAMGPPCRGEGATSTDGAGVGIPTAKRPWTWARPPLQSWFPKEKC